MAENVPDLMLGGRERRKDSWYVGYLYLVFTAELP